MKHDHYLRPDVRLDPLFNQWYAWPHLIAPATAAMNVANSHLRIMKSYVSAPEVHAAAVKNPAMRGGPFIDLDATRVEEVRALVERTERERADLLRLAEAVKSLSGVLASEARGYSLESLYARVPEPLKGYVELVYDLNNAPAIRFVEGLLYRSRYYDRSAQSIALSRVDHDDRPFVFSNPFLPEPGREHIPVPFASEGIDALFRLRDTAGPWEPVREALGLQSADDARFAPFLCETRSPRAEPYRGERARIRYFGHACVLVEHRGVSILTDPVVSYAYGAGLPRYTYEDLPDRIDYVLITHGHADHLLFESLLQLRHKIGTVVVPRSGSGALQDPSLKLVLRHVGFRDVVEIDEMESLDAGSCTITGIPFFGEHADLNIRGKSAYHVRAGDRSVLFAADSSNIAPELYRHVRDSVGEVDVLFVGMECDGAPLSWLYGQLLTKPMDRRSDTSRRLCGSDCERAAAIVHELRCGQVYVYAMGQEPWLGYITSIKYTEESKPIVESRKLVDLCRREGRVAEVLYGSKELFL